MSNCQTRNGTVHIAQISKVGSRTLVAPTCRKFNLDQLHYVIPTDRPVTCKACLRKAAK